MKKQKAAPAEKLPMKPAYQSRLIFTKAQENTLVEYLLECSRIFYGIPPRECRVLAYEMAVINNIPIPQTWSEKGIAGVDWLDGFLVRNPILSRRTPEGCSLSRATSFNQHNVNIFYKNLYTLMKREECFANGTRVFNLDETATTTVHKPPKILAERGVKQVSKCTSGERGTLVTSCLIVSAVGNTVPPAMVFPRVNFRAHMVAGAPPGTLGLASKSGWMTSELFIQVMQHFINHTKSSKDNPTLLIYDNHESHLSINVLNLAKDNGVNVLTLPPHSTNKLQPLDVGINKPFKTYYDQAVDEWMTGHPATPMSIYDIAACMGIAHRRAMTPTTIMAAFRKTGIMPYAPDVFSDADFKCSSVTDRPQITVADSNSDNEVPSTSGINSNPDENNVDISQTADSNSDNDTQTTTTSGITSKLAETTVGLHSGDNSPAAGGNKANIGNETPSKSEHHEDSESTTPASADAWISPALFRGYPKGGPRKNSRPGRAKGRCMIATDTPEKLILEEKQRKRKSTTCKDSKRKCKIKDIPKIIKEIDSDIESSSDDEDLQGIEKLCESSGDDFDEESNLDPHDFGNIDTPPKVGDYVLVFFLGKKNKFYYIGQILKDKDTDGDFEITFLRASRKMPGKFVKPEKADISSVRAEDVKLVLPKPTVFGQTRRQMAHLTFSIGFGSIEIR